MFYHSNFVDYYQSIVEGFNLKLKCFIQKPISINDVMKHLHAQLIEPEGFDKNI